VHHAELDRTLDTLAALAEFEQSLSDMYRACGELWAEDAPMWDHLKQSELGHVECMRQISAMLSERPERFAPGRPLTAAATRCQIDYVAARTAEFRTGSVARRTALLAMREIERSILETRFYEIVVTEDEEYHALAARLLEETVQHFDMLEERLRVNGNGVTVGAGAAT